MGMDKLGGEPPVNSTAEKMSFKSHQKESIVNSLGRQIAKDLISTQVPLAKLALGIQQVVQRLFSKGETLLQSFRPYMAKKEESSQSRESHREFPSPMPHQPHSPNTAKSSGYPKEEASSTKKTSGAQEASSGELSTNMQLAKMINDAQNEIFKSAMTKPREIDFGKIVDSMEEKIKPAQLSEVLKDTEACQFLLQNTLFRPAILQYSRVHKFPEVRKEVLRYVMTDIVKNQEKYYQRADDLATTHNIPQNKVLLELLRNACKKEGLSFSEAVNDPAMRQGIFGQFERLEEACREYEEMVKQSGESAPMDLRQEAYDRGKLHRGNKENFLTILNLKSEDFADLAALKAELKKVMISSHPDKYVGNMDLYLQEKKEKYAAAVQLRQMIENDVYQDYLDGLQGR